MKREITTHVVVHCSASNQNTTYKDVNSWHRARGWLKGGYHRLVYPSGEIIKFNTPEMIEFGRSDDERGAHADVKGKPANEQFNYRSVGVCWIGGKDGRLDITQDQTFHLIRVIVAFMVKYPDIVVNNVIGHNEVPGVVKLCPIIDMDFVRTLVRKKLNQSETVETIPASAWEGEEALTFPDVPRDHWAYDAIEWAVKEAKLVEGKSVRDKIIFDPKAPLTRAELVVIMERFVRYLKGQ